MTSKLCQASSRATSSARYAAYSSTPTAPEHSAHSATASRKIYAPSCWTVKLAIHPITLTWSRSSAKRRSCYSTRLASSRARHRTVTTRVVSLHGQNELDEFAPARKTTDAKGRSRSSRLASSPLAAPFPGTPATSSPSSSTRSRTPAPGATRVVHLPFCRISLPAARVPVINLAAHANRATVAGVPAHCSPKRLHRHSHTRGRCAREAAEEGTAVGCAGALSAVGAQQGYAASSRTDRAETDIKTYRRSSSRV